MTGSSRRERVGLPAPAQPGSIHLAASPGPQGAVSVQRGPDASEVPPGPQGQPGSDAPAPSPGPQGAVAVGIDAVDIGRFRHLLARRPRLAGRLFTATELERAARRVDPVPTLAARFAAKEATMKALGVGVGGIDWHDVEVAAATGGAPVLVVSGRASARADEIGMGRWHVSLTHTETLAVASVVAERTGRGGAPCCLW